MSSKTGIQEGTNIACPKCKKPFAVAAPHEEIDDEPEVVEDFEVIEDDDDEEEAPRKKPASRPNIREKDEVEDDERPEPKKRRSADDDDEKPAKSRKRDDDDDERPAKKRKRDDEDEEDDDRGSRSKKKRKNKKEELSAYGRLKENIWVRVSVLGVLVAILGVVVYISMKKKNTTDEPTPVAKSDEDDLDKPIRPDPTRAQPKKTNEVTSEAQKFNGTWSATSVTMDGLKYPQQGLRDFRWTVMGNLWQSVGNAKNSSRSKIDPSKRPHPEIDLTHLPNNDTGLGIYRFVDKDTLEICLSVNGGTRPTDFVSTAANKCWHLILKRDAVGSPGPNTVVTDADRLKGVWFITRVGVSKQEETELGSGTLASLANLLKTPSGLQGVRMTISDDQFVLDGVDDTDHYNVDITKNPREIDFVRADGSKWLGIFRFINNQTLEICVSLGGERPGSFTPSRDTENAVFVFQRP